MRQNVHKQNIWLLEPVIIIALVTGVLYFIGYYYYRSYFSRLSLPDTVLNFPTAVYMREALIYCFAFAGLVLPSFLNADKKPQTFRQAAIGNLPLLAMGVLGIIYSVRIYHNWIELIFLLFGAIVILVNFLILSKHHISITHYFYRSSWSMRLIFLVPLVLAICLLASYFGQVHATKLIEGSLRNSMIITLELKDGTIFQEGKQLILIMHNNGKYYVAERQTRAPKYPPVYVISDNQIAIATIKRIE